VRYYIARAPSFYSSYVFVHVSERKGKSNHIRIQADDEGFQPDQAFPFGSGLPHELRVVLIAFVNGYHRARE
jgi:hypothetical protein